MYRIKMVWINMIGRLAFFMVGATTALIVTFLLPKEQVEHPVLMVTKWSAAHNEKGIPYTTVRATKYADVCYRMREIFHHPTAKYPMSMECVSYPYDRLDAIMAEEPR